MHELNFVTNKRSAPIAIHAFPSFDHVLTLSRAPLAKLKPRQANARAQVKVAWARALVCWGLATPLPYLIPDWFLHVVISIYTKLTSLVLVVISIPTK